MTRAMVVGGGYAGITAATHLAEAGIRVELLESRGSLGGRAYSVAPSDHFPEPLDNGPHLFMGCYAETRRLLERIGAGDSLHWIDPLALSWLLPGGREVSLRCAPLPAPLHLAWGLLASDAFPFREKFSLARALSAFSRKPFRTPAGASTLSQFLEAAGQGPASRERFWNPLCNAVMNVPPETAPLAGLGEVLHRVFFGTRRDSALGVARKPLGEIIPDKSRLYLESRGSKVRTGEGLQSFAIKTDGIEVKTRLGRVGTCDALILAVPPSSLAALWPPDGWGPAAHFPRMGKSPIVSVHVILDRPVLKGHLLGLSGAKFEWVFNRNENWGREGEGQYLSFTASAADALARLKDLELTDLALGELRERCPAAREARVLHSKATREMAATFLWSPETDRLRPPCETPYPNVFLAGDWTDTGLPATLEGACLSGRRAAEKAGHLGASKG